MTQTFFVTGKMEREIRGKVYRMSISQEVDAASAEAALALFEVDGWEWADTPSARLITEAEKMERIGISSLFPLDEYRGEK